MGAISLPGVGQAFAHGAGTLPSSRLKPISAARAEQSFILTRIVKRLLRSINVPIADALPAPLIRSLPSLLEIPGQYVAGLSWMEIIPIMPPRLSVRRRRGNR